MRRDVFHKPADYDAFAALLVEAKDKAAVDVLAYCLMPNHWHLVLRPLDGADLSRYLH